MPTLLMYERVVAVNRDTHRQWRLRPARLPMAFARGTNAVLLAGTELPLAALDYPCVFVEAEQGMTMVAVVGLRDHENLMVDEQGQWAEHAYVPAFVRRYPFVLATEAGQDEMTVCLDEAFEGFNTDSGEALFDAEGGETPYLQQLKRFMLGYHQDMVRTTQFAARLLELDLLTEQTIDAQLNGQTSSLKGFKVVDEARLRALPPEVVQDLFTSGALGWIHAHLLSLNNVRRLGARLATRLTADQVMDQGNQGVEGAGAEATSAS